MGVFLRNLIREFLFAKGKLKYFESNGRRFMSSSQQILAPINKATSFYPVIYTHGILK